MEGFKKFVKEILYPACLIFTLIVFAFSAAYEIADLYKASAYSIMGLIRFFVFSLVLSWSRMVFKDEKMSFAGAHFLHYIIFLVNVSVSFVVLGRMNNFFGVLVVFSILYGLGAIVALIVRRISKKHQSEKKKANYKKQFK